MSSLGQPVPTTPLFVSPFPFERRKQVTAPALVCLALYHYHYYSCCCCCHVFVALSPSKIRWIPSPSSVGHGFRQLAAACLASSSISSSSSLQTLPVLVDLHVGGKMSSHVLLPRGYVFAHTTSSLRFRLKASRSITSSNTSFYIFAKHSSLVSL